MAAIYNLYLIWYIIFLAIYMYISLKSCDMYNHIQFVASINGSKPQYDIQTNLS